MRFKSLLAAAALTIGSLGYIASANSAVIGFNDVISGGVGLGTEITFSTPLSFTHDINGQVTIASDLITFANLSIKMSDPRGGDESFNVALDLAAQPEGNVSNSGFTFYSFDTGTSILTLAMLQADGKINVTLSVGCECESVYFQRSDLSGFADQGVLPEPGTVALFGMGLLGLGLVRRRQAAKA